MSRVYLVRYDSGHRIPLLANCADGEAARMVERLGFQRVTRTEYMAIKADWYTLRGSDKGAYRQAETK